MKITIKGRKIDIKDVENTFLNEIITNDKVKESIDRMIIESKEQNKGLYSDYYHNSCLLITYEVHKRKDNDKLLLRATAINGQGKKVIITELEKDWKCHL